jgi:hypothetical protein
LQTTHACCRQRVPLARVHLPKYTMYRMPPRCMLCSNRPSHYISDPLSTLRLPRLPCSCQCPPSACNPCNAGASFTLLPPCACSGPSCTRVHGTSTGHLVRPILHLSLPSLHLPKSTGRLPHLVPIMFHPMQDIERSSTIRLLKSTLLQSTPTLRLPKTTMRLQRSTLQ